MVFEDTPLGTATVLLVGVIAGAVLLYRSRKTWTTRPRVARIAVLTIAVCGILLVFELYFAFFFVASDAGSYTLSDQKWMRKYWHPINALGYRDRDYRRADFRGKSIVYVVGDSFVAGAGINDAADRFPDLLQGRLGPDHVVVNIAIAGWSTTEEYDAMVEFSRRFAISPDVVVLSYYINDIRGSAEDLGIYPRIRGVPPVFLFLARNSNFFDFAFWRLYRISRIFDVFWVHIENYYNDDDIWATHARKLDDVVTFAERHDARLVVLAFPSLVKIDFSKPLTSKVCDHFRSRGADCIDLAEDLESWRTRDRIVSTADPHPSVELHEHVGNTLADRILAGASTVLPEDP